jgi:hypothetical protein
MSPSGSISEAQYAIRLSHTNENYGGDIEFVLFKLWPAFKRELAKLREKVEELDRMFENFTEISIEDFPAFVTNAHLAFALHTDELDNYDYEEPKLLPTVVDVVGMLADNPYLRAGTKGFYWTGTAEYVPGRFETDLIHWEWLDVCSNCLRPPDEHAKKKCLFGPMTYQPRGAV